MSLSQILQPFDQHNQLLQSHVHPTDWINPTPAGRYHLVVIGAGTAGLVTAAGAAGLGARVALIERDLMGGDCLNVGCVPSKALLGAARIAASVRRAGQFGVQQTSAATVDFAAVMERMRRLRAGISPHDSAARFRSLGIDVFLGAGQFLDGSTIEVAGQKLAFSKAVIATGARAVELPVPGLRETGCLTNETLFSLTELPRRLIVIGGGPIGAEMAQAFARFGSSVTLLEASAHILSKEDPDAAQVVQQAMIGDGVNVLTKTAVVRMERRGAEKVVVVLQDGQEREIMGDEVLVGIGRAPNVHGLGLEQVGVSYDIRAGVQVNDFLQTTNRRIYACGDVCSPFKFTHAADFLARTVIRNSLFAGRSRASALTIPWCTYTSPELAHVGLTAAQAQQRGTLVDTYTQRFDAVDRAILEGDTEGFARVHVKKGSDRIVGATIVAPHAGDMIGELVMAMNHGIGLGKIASVIHPYPTSAEAIRKLGDQYNRTRLTPFVKNLFRQWLAWT